MTKHKSEKKVDKEFYAQVAIVIVLSFILIFSFSSSSKETNIVSASSIIPTGVPAVYGEELGISFDDVSVNNAKKADATIRLLGNIDRVEELDSTQLDRYIEILYNMNGGISCEYCCGARSVIFENGQAACGCAHSYAMRGVTKYLIKYHGDEFTNEQILEEASKWKILFFPGIIEGKAQVMEGQGIEINHINLATNKYRGIEKGKASGGMVGGC